MLHRTTSTSTWWPDRTVGWRAAFERSLRTSLSSALARYLLLLAAICALGCIYLWQANDLSDLYRDIVALEGRATQLEIDNIRLAQQSALWNAPGYVEKRLREEGFVDAQSVVYSRLPLTLTQPASDGVPADATQQVAHSSGSQ